MDETVIIDYAKPCMDAVICARLNIKEPLVTKFIRKETNGHTKLCSMVKRKFGEVRSRILHTNERTTGCPHANAAWHQGCDR